MKPAAGAALSASHPAGGGQIAHVEPWTRVAISPQDHLDAVTIAVLIDVENGGGDGSP